MTVSELKAILAPLPDDSLVPIYVITKEKKMCQSGTMYEYDGYREVDEVFDIETRIEITLKEEIRQLDELYTFPDY